MSEISEFPDKRIAGNFPEKSSVNDSKNTKGPVAKTRSLAGRLKDAMASRTGQAKLSDHDIQPESSSKVTSVGRHSLSSSSTSPSRGTETKTTESPQSSPRTNSAKENNLIAVSQHVSNLDPKAWMNTAHLFDMDPKSNEASTSEQAEKSPRSSMESHHVVQLSKFLKKEKKIIPLGKELGHGANASVFSIGETKAMKIPLEGMSPDDKKEVEKSLKNEKKILARLNRGKWGHTGVQGTQKTCLVKNNEITTTVVVTKKYSKGSLHDYLQKNRAMPMAERKRIGRDLVKGLQLLRKEGVNHGDLNPRNCYLGEKRAVIGDFGGAMTEKGSATAESFDFTYLPKDIHKAMDAISDVTANIKDAKQVKGAIQKLNIDDRYKHEGGFFLAGKAGDVFGMGIILYSLFVKSGEPPPGAAFIEDEEIDPEDVKNELTLAIPEEDRQVRDLIYKMICNYKEVSDNDLQRLNDALK